MANRDCIAENALQIYCSALPSTPKETVLFKTYKDLAMGQIRVLAGADDRWGPLLASLPLSSRGVLSLTFSNDGNRLAVGGFRNEVEVLSVMVDNLVEIQPKPHRAR
jgi:hypothetical protein